MAESQSKFKVIIVGAGPNGLITANALAAAGIDFVVMEQQPDVVRFQGAVILLWPGVVRLLDQLGVLERFLQFARPLDDKNHYNKSGRLTWSGALFRHAGDYHGYPVLAAPRADLIRVLYENLADRETRVRTNSRVAHIETLDDGVRVYLQQQDGDGDGGGTTTTSSSVVEGSMVIGADGVHSQTRKIVERSGSGGPNSVEGRPMTASYRCIFGRAPNTHGVKTESWYEWHGSWAATQSTALGDWLYFSLLQRLPSPVVVAVAAEGQGQGRDRDRERFTDAETEEMARAFADVPVYPGVRFRELWPARDRATTRLVLQQEGFAERWHNGRVVLVGDAAHKMTSVWGMGVSTGSNNAVVLVNGLRALLAESPSSSPDTAALERVFAAYQRRRQRASRNICRFSEQISRTTLWYSWRDWLMDRYVGAWADAKTLAERDIAKLVSRSEVLDFVPFDEKEKPKVPWRKAAPARL
ncbi:FAD/NAD(P)-binding domain-containing protein [Xylariomycetidae sp. FL2044]|nr:FAD/NAD(P)-binding domain-containing protein [Xylariomycetidae sp. FL2044]